MKLSSMINSIMKLSSMINSIMKLSSMINSMKLSGMINSMKLSSMINTMKLSSMINAMKLNSMINSIMNPGLMNRTKKQSTGKHSCRFGTDRIQLSRTGPEQSKIIRDTYPDGDVLLIKGIISVDENVFTREHLSAADFCSAEKTTFAGGAVHGYV